VERINDIIQFLSGAWNKARESEEKLQQLQPPTAAPFGVFATPVSVSSSTTTNNESSTSSIPYRCDIIRTDHSITLVFPRSPASTRAPPPPIQVVLRLYSSIAEVLMVGI
jgi:hypothetical protein